MNPIEIPNLWHFIFNNKGMFFLLNAKVRSG